MTVSIADGHGAEECFRSNIGSSIAVEIATKISQYYLKKKKIYKTLFSDQKQRDKFVNKLVKQWLICVLKHYKKNPLTSKEIATIVELDEKKSKKITQRPVTIYGSTLITALIYDQQIILFQIGDGDVMLVSNEKEIIFPIERPEGLLGNETTSLCNVNSARLFQSAVIKDINPSLIVLSTDGYSNSFSSHEDFKKVGIDFLELENKNGFQMIKDNMHRWLEETTKTGSGDDTTVAVIRRIDKNKEIANHE